MVIHGIKLFPRQEAIFNYITTSVKRFVTLNASRQFSKSTILENVLMFRALNMKRMKCLYVTPTYSLSKIVMNKLYNNLLDSGAIKTYNKAENIITFSNGSEVYFRSSTNPDNIRGLSIHYLFIDEAAFQSDDTWNVIRPTMNVIGKQCVMASTPRGKSGFFYQSCMIGQTRNANYHYEFGHYSDNPFYNRDEVEDARKTLPEAVFNQEYEAQFLDDGGSVFSNIRNCQKIYCFKGNLNEGPYSIGIDLGRQSDFTVVTVLNNRNEVVDIYRDNLKDWTLIINNIKNILKKYYGASILCETNGIGDVVFDLLKKEVHNIKPFITTNESKNSIIEELIHAFQTESISIPTGELFSVLQSELSTYSFTYSPKTRRIIYSAMNGFHDDCVISLALSLRAKTKKEVRWTLI